MKTGRQHRIFQAVNFMATKMYAIPQWATEPSDAVVFIVAGLESVGNTEPLGQASHFAEFRLVQKDSFLVKSPSMLCQNVRPNDQTNAFRTLLDWPGMS